MISACATSYSNLRRLAHLRNSGGNWLSECRLRKSKFKPAQTCALAQMDFASGSACLRKSSLRAQAGFPPLGGEPAHLRKPAHRIVRVWVLWLAETEGRAELERGSRPQQSGGSAPVQTDRQAVPLPPGLGTVPASRPLRAGTTPNGVQSDTSETWVVGVDVVDGEVVGHG